MEAISAATAHQGEIRTAAQFTRSPPGRAVDGCDAIGRGCAVFCLPTSAEYGQDHWVNNARCGYTRLRGVQHRPLAPDRRNLRFSGFSKLDEHLEKTGGLKPGRTGSRRGGEGSGTPALVGGRLSLSVIGASRRRCCRERSSIPYGTLEHTGRP